jgi:hypothetical protein
LKYRLRKTVNPGAWERMVVWGMVSLRYLSTFRGKGRPDFVFIRFEIDGGMGEVEEDDGGEVVEEFR